MVERFTFIAEGNSARTCRSISPLTSKRPPVLLLGHFDTVWDLGTLASMPFREADGRLWGPGVLDMKSGIAQMIFAIESLRRLRGQLPRPVTVLLVTDEEVGSESSRPMTESLARKCGAVLVIEPSYGLDGALKTARKGVGDYTLKVKGRAAHAGLDFEKGASAILELSKQVTEIAKFTDLKQGITVNAGVIRGGTRTNVIADEAEAEFDLRISAASQAKTMDRKFRALTPFDPRCQLEISGGINRPPLERTEKVLELFRDRPEDRCRNRLASGRSFSRRRLRRQLHCRTRNSYPGWSGCGG